MNKNISYTTKNDLCVGCGLCSDACAKDCISISNKKGRYIPQINKEKCNNCGFCLKICPGIGIPIHSYEKELYQTENLKYDNHIGYFHKCYAAHSNNQEIRYHCASGGMVTQFIIYLLEKKHIDGAIIVKFDKKNPMLPKAFIAREKKEVINGKSSKYCVVSHEGIVKKILSENGRYVIVGLPCLIHGFRKYEKNSKKLKERIIGHFALLCSATKNLKSQNYILNRYKVNINEVTSFSYRDEGCLGHMMFKNNNEVLFKKDYISYFKPLRGFFNPARCALCVDHYGELSDISFGDLHVGEYMKDKIGINSIITRSLKWDSLLKKAQEEKELTLKEIESETLKQSQLYAYKHKKGPGVVAAYKVRKYIGMKNPNYDITFNQPLRFKFIIREMCNYVCRFIGNHESLWFIIKFLDRNK